MAASVRLKSIFTSAATDSKLRRRALVQAVTLALGLSIGSAYSATIIVDSPNDEIVVDDVCTLREAIEAANSDLAFQGCSAGSGPDIISLASIADSVIALALGQLPEIDSQITINGANSTLDAQQQSRHFRLNGASANLTLNELTLLKGSAQEPNVADKIGGSIHVESGLLTLNNCTLSNNTAYDGGAISAPTSTVVLNNSVLSGNSASSQGGGIYAQSVTMTGSTISMNSANYIGGGIRAVSANLTDSVVDASVGNGIRAQVVTLLRSTVSNNRHVVGGSGQGGGINATTVLLTDSNLVDNYSALHGGGIIATSVSLFNSSVSGNFSGSNGGGIYADTLTVENSQISGNNARAVYSSGGGLSVNGHANISGATFNNNSSEFGGGLFAYSASISDSTFSGNTAYDGGAISVHDLTLTDSRVTNNSAYKGGGIFGINLTVTRTTIAGNVAAEPYGYGSGGGVYAQSSLTLTDSTLSNNFSNYKGGGGVFAQTAIISNSTLAGNSTTGSGGAVRALNIYLTHTTLNANSASVDGGGISVGNLFEYGGSAILTNSIIAGSVNGDCGLKDGAVSTQGMNLVQDGGAGCGLAVGQNLLAVDPMLGPLANNRGPTQTHLPLTGSPVIDVGDNNFSLMPNDQRGTGYLRIFNTLADIGSVEVQPIMNLIFENGFEPSEN